MTNTTDTNTPTAAIYGADITADDAREIARLLDMVGQRVRRTGGTFEIEGTLESVYVTDGVACNIHGDHGDFAFGPLYGDHVSLVVDLGGDDDPEGIATPDNPDWAGMTPAEIVEHEFGGASTCDMCGESFDPDGAGTTSDDETGLAFCRGCSTS